MTAFVYGKKISAASSSIVQAAVAITLHLFLFKIYQTKYQLAISPSSGKPRKIFMTMHLHQGSSDAWVMNSSRGLFRPFNLLSI